MTARLIAKNLPPINRTRRRDYAATEWNALLARAVKSPGKWFVIDPPYNTPSSAASTAHDIRTGRNRALPKGLWDAASRECDLYVKFLGA